ncbi:glycosyltransferase family 4 protein [Natronolimnobius sp. AArcel1]|uniref:glycosyltransferase family 4 protein n=1 Tax=Natronolimnobius sp. AArcel1 TaxID=1679093 RepID=UPI0013EBCBDF|nr:glycosyltransferase family 4 protein [Natronolimnobius sp. AArcel1]NGM71402.1 glycosyltransferase family 4 protein [Natronolimnobius sp. AArcel1]
MHVSIIAGSLDLTGAGSNISLDILARTLTEYGHNVEVITIDPTGSNALTYDTPYSVSTISELVRKKHISSLFNSREFKLLEGKSDIFHIFDPIFAPIFGYYRYLGGSVPVVCRLNSYTMFCSNTMMMDGNCHKNCSTIDRVRHSESSTGSKVFKSPLFLISSLSIPDVVNSIDKFFAQSPSVKNIYEETGIDPQKIKVITNFYDPDFGEPNTERKVDFERDCFNVLYVGRVKEKKGVDLLLDASQHSEFDLTIDIVGDGEARASLETQAKSLSIGDNINFHGWVDHDDLKNYYGQSNLFVQPSRWVEPSGRALLEAMQYNCPAVVSNIGGPPWIVGNAGLVFEKNNSKDLANKIDLLYKNKEKYKDLRRKCSSRIDGFNPEKIIREIEEEYISATSNGY